MRRCAHFVIPPEGFTVAGAPIVLVWKHVVEGRQPMQRSFLYRCAIAGAIALSLAAPASAQQGPPGCNWKKYLYAQDAVQQGKMDTALLNQMSTLMSAQ